jgi:predicted RNA-binding protein
MESLPFRYQQRQYWEYYCPMCKIQRRSAYWPSPRRHHYARLALLTVCLTVGLWPFFDMRGAFLIFPIWAVFEFTYRARARQSLICNRCGFDPYLYKYDVKLARDRVARHWAAKSPPAPVAPASEKNAPPAG